MDYFYNLESFDITHLEQYRGKKLEELFPNHRNIKNEMGEFMELFWEADDIPSNLRIQDTKDSILRNLKTVYYIGEHTEKHFFKRGVKTLHDLRIMKKYRHSTNQILTYLKNKDYRNLVRNRYLYDIDVSFCFDLEDFLFLDIETLGLYDGPMILVGVGFFRDSKFKIHLFFARNIEEEIAICEHLKHEVLPDFKCFVTYNGKSFDIPFIGNRFLYFFEENPMISQEESPYEMSNTKFHHIDLYHQCRRIYRGKFESYSLTNMEEKLLKWNRKNELPSNLVGVCYKKYLKNPEKYVGLIKEIIEHNYYDVYSMPLILKKLLK